MERPCETCGAMMHVRSNRCVECGSFCTAKATVPLPAPAAPPLPKQKRPVLKLPADASEGELEPPAEAAPPSPRSRPKQPAAARAMPPPPRPGSPLPPVPSRETKPELEESADSIVASLQLVFKSPRTSEEPHELAPPPPLAVAAKKPPPVPSAASKPAEYQFKKPAPAPVKPKIQVTPEPRAHAPAPPSPPPVPSAASRRRATSLDEQPEAAPPAGVGGRALAPPPPVPSAAGRRVSGEGPMKKPPPVPDASKRRTAEHAGLTASAGEILVTSPSAARKSNAEGGAAVPTDCRSALQDPYWRTQLQAFAAEHGREPLLVFWTLVDEFKQATNPRVRSALADRLQDNFIADNAPHSRVLEAAESERAQLAQEFAELGELLPPLTFFDAVQGTVELEIERDLYPVWRASAVLQQTQQRRPSGRGGVIGAPTLTTQPKTKYTLVPIKEAQSAAGVESRADDSVPPHGYGSAHRRSVSLGSGIVAPLAAGLGPSPFAKKTPHSPPAEKKAPSPPPPRPQRAPQVQAQQHAVEKFVGGDEWDTESILSDACKFDWDLLNASNTEPKLEVIKCLVTGDAGVGKTVLCKTMLGDVFDADYRPTVFETYKIRVPLFREVPVEVWDMSGNSKYDKKRPVVYPNVNAFLICFDLTSKESWRNVKRKWVPEAMSYADFPLLIAGCKFDCINAANAQMCVQAAQVNSFLDKKCRGVFKSAHFVSTSALKGVGLDQLFAAIVYTAMYVKRKPDEINSGIARIKHLEFIK